MRSKRLRGATPRWVFFCLLMGACSSAHGGDEDAGLEGSPDGAATPPDGAVTLPDGAVVLPDGAIVLPDAGVGSDGGDPLIDAALTRDGGGTDTGPMATVGTPCTTDVDCPGLFCSPLGSGFGYCSWICGDTMPCPGDSVCGRFDPEASYGYCMPRCDPGADDCAMGNRCQAGIASEPVCYPGCAIDADCGAGRRCGFGVSGVRQCYTPDAMVGQPCALSRECPEAGYCIDEATWGTPAGLCTTFCDLDGGGGCLAETTCVPWGFMSGAGACLPVCDMMHPCRAGFECRPTATAGVSACVPWCRSDADCTDDRTCSFITGRCG